MFCSVTGEVPEEPVVSKKTGHVFEKRVVQKHIEATGKCPVTNQDLSLDDLVPVQFNKAIRPRAPAAASIPGLLSIFQSEWDALMLETHQLKQQLELVRQELSQSLYQHDAACRVIARLIQERDAARAALANAQATITATVGAAPPSQPETMEVETKQEGELPAEASQKIQATSKQLSKSRKKRAISPNLATPEQIAEYACTSSHPLHKASQPGILCLDIHPRNQELVATGGVDHSVIVFNRSSQKVGATLSEHTKKVLDVQFHPEDMLFSCSADKTARVWKRASEDSGFECVHTFRHKGEVSGLSLHPTNDFLATASADQSWDLHDIRTGQTIAHVTHPEVTDGYSCISIHPDGAIMATGNRDSTVRVWLIHRLENVATFKGHTGVITSLAFSENGYYLATAAEDSCVRLWDLRKDLNNFRTLVLDENSGNTRINSIHFDYSGQYLSVAHQSRLTLFNTKGWNVVRTFDDHSGDVTDAAFGNDAQFLSTVSKDRTLKFFSLA